jgi:hypothetical protein
MIIPLGLLVFGSPTLIGASGLFQLIVSGLNQDSNSSAGFPAFC